MVSVGPLLAFAYVTDHQSTLLRPAFLAFEQAVSFVLASLLKG